MHVRGLFYRPIFLLLHDIYLRIYTPLNAAWRSVRCKQQIEEDTILMLDFDNPLGFDLFQQLVEWINISMRDFRKGRHFLESNALLMGRRTEKTLDTLSVASTEVCKLLPPQ